MAKLVRDHTDSDNESPADLRYLCPCGNKMEKVAIELRDAFDEFNIKEIKLIMEFAESKGWSTSEFIGRYMDAFAKQLDGKDLTNEERNMMADVAKEAQVRGIATE